MDGAATAWEGQLLHGAVRAGQWCGNRPVGTGTAWGSESRHRGSESRAMVWERGSGSMAVATGAAWTGQLADQYQEKCSAAN